MAEDFQRRLPSVERGISGIKAEDIRISILGTVIDKKEEGETVRIALDDGTGKIDVGFESAVKVAVNQFVRVFGRVIPIENGFELQGEVVQDMGKLDVGLWKRVKDLNLRD
jgi:RPA family protein